MSGILGLHRSSLQSFGDFDRLSLLSENLSDSRLSVTRLDLNHSFSRTSHWRSRAGLHFLPTATSLNVDAGNTLSSALDIGVLNSSQTFNDFVGSSDNNDYYRFTLSTAANFNLSLTGLSSDADVQLLNSSGGVLASSEAGSTISEAIRQVLAAGSYYIRVFPYTGSTNYTLTLSATAVIASSGFNSTYGYGLVNAAAAVAQSIGQPTFTDVANQGGNNWNLDAINAPEVWAQGYTGQGIVVAVVDTGVDYTHPDLDNNIWTNAGEIEGNGIDDDGNGYIDDVRGWNFVEHNNNPFDTDSHGTHVAGTIAAENNGFGATGVAYNAQIMAVRVLGNNGGRLSDVAAGIRYAADNGADVINLSLGGSSSSSTVTSAIQYAVQRGATVVMAAGNEAAQRPGFPANLANQYGIAVGAVDRSNRLASFSNRAGTSTTNYVVAPGASIYSTTPNNTYRNYSGTSMATPAVAGVAALLLNANASLTPGQVVGLLAGTANSTAVTV